jgi:glycosyltransferase involved in cell wall biosynthesis
VQNFLLVVQTLGVGVTEWEKAGIVEREFAVLKFLNRIGWEICIVSSSRGDRDDQRRIRKTYPDFNFVFVGSNPVFSALRCFFVKSDSFSQKKSFGKLDNLVIRTNQLYCSHLGLIFKHRFKSKLVIRQGFNLVYDALRDPEMSRTRKHFFKFYEKVFLPMADLCEFTTELSYKQSQSRIREDLKFAIIPNFVDKTHFPSRAMRQPNLSSPTLGYYGRFQAQKNLENLIKSAKSFPLVQFQLIGDGCDKTKLQQLVVESQLTNVDIIERVPQKDIKRYFQSWDFAIFPSLYEGNPKAILEMLFACVPILSTNVDGIAGLLIDEENSLLTSDLDSNGISNLISRALEMDYSRTNVFVENGYKKVESTYSLEKVASQIDQTYRKLSHAE